MDKFIIVIEADNKRALAAYSKGLHDIDVIMPQLMASAESFDEERQLEREAKLQEEKSGYEEYKRLLDLYKSDLSLWRSTCSLFRGDRPIEPKMDLYRYRYLSELDFYPSRVSSIKSIRAELKDMADLAGAAIGPFKMTEYKVKEMVAWEDGSRIEEIKRCYIDGAAF